VALHVALLRGINVGGKHKLPMKELCAMFEAAGCERVRSFIQSGNVVFDASPALAKTIPDRVGAAIRDTFGFDSAIILRTAKELRSAFENNPLLDPPIDPKFLYLGVLAKAPSKTALAKLEPDRFAPDVFAVRGRDIYLRYPNGVARSKLTNAYLDARVGMPVTMRNWNTVTKLVQLVASMV
jgi:uncharacterized protein (DUF1697 family)